MPRIDYRNSKGERLPGVTTVIDILAKPGLTGWAYQQGLAGVPLYEKRDRAADAGTLAHAMVEAHLKSQPAPRAEGLDGEIVSKAESCFLAFLEWERTHQFRMVDTELSLVSEQHGFGGTIDIGAIVGDLGIVDIKTSKDVWLSHKVQVAAYGRLYEEVKGERIKGYHILRLGAQGDFSHHYYPNLDNHWQIFLHCLGIWKLLKKMDERL